MFCSSSVPATIFQRIATWANQFQPVGQQTPTALIIRHQPPTRASLLRHAKGLQQEAQFHRERLKTFRNRKEDEEYFLLEAERCENAAQRIQTAIAEGRTWSC